MRTVAVIVAAGRGRRMGAGAPKQFLPLARKPILAHTLAVFEAAEIVDEVLVVVPRDEVARCRTEVVEKYRFRKVRAVLPGGRKRQDSVLTGLRAIEPPCDVVCVHDGVRPFVRPDAIERSVRTAARLGASVVAVPVTDTIKIATDDGFVKATPDRCLLWAAATPQSFRYGMLLDAYERAERDGFLATDDAMVVERTGASVLLIEGTPDNIKITTPEDLALARAILKRRRAEDRR
jgi:2-C-methyl-D-erythritol 4-phosphate cytidylyltransferase